MRIAPIVPGFGGSFYCENCIRDLELPRGRESVLRLFDIRVSARSLVKAYETHMS